MDTTDKRLKHHTSLGGSVLVDAGLSQTFFLGPAPFSNTEFSGLSSTAQAVDLETLLSGSQLDLIRPITAIVGLVLT